jgi:membrane-bound serine protease (ClpP class)
MRQVAQQQTERRLGLAGKLSASVALRFTALASFLWMLSAGVHVSWSQPERESGAYLVVRSPLSSEAVNQLRNEIEHHIGLGVRKIILHFQPGAPSSLGVARDLANYLFREIRGRANIHAYADKPLSGHLILPFLAAEYRWLGPEGALGKVTVGQEAPLSKADRAIYEEIARGRGLYLAVVLRLIYQPLSVYQVIENGQRTYKLEDTPLARQLEIPPDLLIGAGEGGQLVIPGGEGASVISAEQAAREFRLVSGKVSGLEELVDELHLDRAVLLGSVAVNPESKVAWIVVSNDLDAGTVSTLRRKWERAVQKLNAGCVVFEIGAGGNARGAQEVARLIQDIQREQGKVLTVAYIPKRASGAATYLAFACREIVLCQSAELGDMQQVRGSGRRVLSPLELEPYVRSLRELTRFHGGEALAEALFDPELELVRVRAKKEVPGAGATFVLRRDEAERRRAEFEILDRPFRLLTVTGQQARALGVSRFVLPDDASREAVLNLFGLKRENTVEMRSDWLDELVNIIAHPVTTVFLFILGFTCLLLEFKTGGIGLPAVIAAVCFVLMFWAHSWLAREVNSLAILLFMLGLVLLLVELFVLPGMVVAGFSGVLLVICSVALLLVQHWPQSTEEYFNLAKYLGILGGGLVAAIALAFLIGRHLPSVPFLKGLVLPPPEPVSPTETTAVPVQEYQQYVGAVGVATTALRPAGKARFGDVQLDVIAEGQYLEAGTRVQIVQVEGTRIVVQALPSP